ncbi:hypothetical protein ACWD25_27235 [Streptomyces sp. NPDC002920]
MAPVGRAEPVRTRRGVAPPARALPWPHPARPVPSSASAEQSPARSVLAARGATEPYLDGFERHAS